MPLLIGVPAETLAGERRLAVVPDVIKRYVDLGAQIRIQAGAGLPAHFHDDVFAGAQIVATAEEIYAEADVVLCVQPPSKAMIDIMRPGTVLLGLLQPWADKERLAQLCEKQITAFALELLPRISRAQSMDALSSQAAVAGYQCALIAADHSSKFFPMLTYAAGTIRPAKALVIGAGVAGLQAIATARRIGAMVEAYDVRPETREQIESLGAKFVDTGVSAVGAGGYARELTEEEKAKQTERLAKAVGQCDALITTASIPGRRAPVIITKDMLARMKPGSVVVDMAAESGGNVEGSVTGDKVWIGDVLVVGPANIASRMPVHSSEMYAKNLYNFISPFIKEGALSLDWEDEIVAGTCLTHAGEVRSARVREMLGL